MKKNKKLKLKRIYILVGILFFLLMFIIFPYIGKKLVIKEKYSPRYLRTEKHKLETELIFNNIMGEAPFTKRLLEEIDKANKSIDIAMYSIDSPDIRNALFKAAERGVRVSFVSDSKKREQHTKFFEDSPKNFTFKDVPAERKEKVEPYMHNKFAIIDYGEKNETLLTGAWNWTVIQELTDPTYLLITKEKEIVSSYEEEFQRLFSDRHSKLKFKDKNYKPFNKKINYLNSYLEIWFSPGIGSNSIKERMYDLIDSSKKTIDIMIWQMTDKKMVKKLIDAEKRGVYINILMDDFNITSKDSVFKYMKEQIKTQNINNINIYTDATRVVNIDGLESLNSYLHHHMIISDNKVVLFGTNNWGKRGAYENDENTIITNNNYIVSEFIKTFEYQHRELKKGFVKI